jgi:hypothetical protein
MEQRRMAASQRKADEEKARQAELEKKKKEDGERRKREREEANTTKATGVKKVREFRHCYVHYLDCPSDGRGARQEAQDYCGDREKTWYS